MPGPAPKHILQAMDRIGRAIEDRERTRLIAVGAEVERQSDAQTFIGRVMMAFLWDNVALYAALVAVREAGWPWPNWIHAMVEAREDR
jgi:hypothetical protein